ncbi:MAG TPA: hypothetical protein VHA34_02050 [Actinomycetes bacterium]|nr:hypothetical protein [Actinomycetes bacterium]
MFLGDDGFGVEVARRLAGESLPGWVRVGAEVPDPDPAGERLAGQPPGHLDPEPVVTQEHVPDPGDQHPGGHWGSTSSGEK